MNTQLRISKKHQYEAIDKFEIANRLDTSKQWLKTASYYHALSNVYLRSRGIALEFILLANICTQRAFS